MISAGAIVTVRQFGSVAWVVHRHVADGRFKCISKAVDDRGREALSSRTTGEGDLVLIVPAPIFEPGVEVTFNGSKAAVLEDRGDVVVVNVPPTRFRTRGGDYLKIVASRADANKADLVLAKL